MNTISASYPTLSTATTGTVPRSHAAESIASGVDQESVTLSTMAEKLQTQATEQEQVLRNLNDGVSTVQLSDHALEHQSALVQQMRELAVQAANGTYSSSNREMLQSDLNQLQQELRNSAQQAQFNNQSLLTQNGSLGIAGGGSSSIEVPTFDIPGSFDQLGLFSLDLSTPQGATDALGVLDQSQELITQNRGELGATANQLEVRSQATTDQNLVVRQSASQLIDTDYAASTAELVREQIVQSVEVAMQSHSNLSRTNAMQLLGV